MAHYGIEARSLVKLPASPQLVANAAAARLSQPAPPLPKRKKTNTAPSPRTEAAPLLPVSLPPGVFAVETIVDIKVRGERVVYLVKWAGYDASSNSWEPETNILDPALLAAFHRSHGAEHQAAMAAVANAKQAKAAASTASHVSRDQQSRAEVQQLDRSNRAGRVIVAPARYLSEDD